MLDFGFHQFFLLDVILNKCIINKKVDTIINIKGLVCTGAVIAATFLSINELKDVNEPSVKTMDVAEGAKRHLKLISTAILIIIGFVSLGLFCFYFIFA